MDKNCDKILAEQNCIQFYVKSSNGKQYILHEDEIDITGMCTEQTHCSGWYFCMESILF